MILLGVDGAVLVRGAVRGGGNLEPERYEPEPEPMARIVLIRARIAELGAEDLEGATGELGGRSEGSVGACESELVGPAGKVLRGGRGQGSEGGNVCEGIHLLRSWE